MSRIRTTCPDRPALAPARALLGLVLAGALAGCPRPEGPGAERPHPPPIAYRAFAEAYNRRVAAIEQMWSRAIMEIRWVDEQGKKHFEQGDGHLILRKPDQLALAIGRLGNTMYWLGCDARRYWLFDLKPPEGQPRTAFFGRRALSSRADLPLPIAPDRLLDLLAVQPLPVELPDGAKWQQEGPFLVLQHPVTLPGVEPGPPGRDPAETPALIGRWRFDLQHHYLLEHTVIDAAGRVVLQVQLSQYESLALQGRPPGAWPAVPRRFEMSLPGRQVHLTLTLTEKTNDPARIKDVQFQFEQLVQRLQVDQIIDLDHPPAGRE